MTYEELKIQLDIGDPYEVLKSMCMVGDNKFWFAGDNGDFHLLDQHGNELDISQVKGFAKGMALANAKAITMPDSIESIGDYAFEWCTSLKSIEIPESVWYIGDWVFYKCKSLESIIIPASVKNIGYNVFAFCRSLKSIVFKGKTMEQVRAMTGYPWGTTGLAITCI